MEIKLHLCGICPTTRPSGAPGNKWTCLPSLRTNLGWHPTRPRASEELSYLPCNSTCLDFSSATLERDRDRGDREKLISKTSGGLMGLIPETLTSLIRNQLLLQLLPLAGTRALWQFWLSLNSPYPWHTWDRVWLLSHLLKEKDFILDPCELSRTGRSQLVGYSSAFWRWTLIVLEYPTLSFLGGAIIALGEHWTDKLQYVPHPSPCYTGALSRPQPKSIKCHEGSG